MYCGKRLAVVVPCYNAAGHVGQVVATMPEVVDDIIVVDDGSTDDSASRARDAGDHRVRVLAHGTNMGVGAALVTGYTAALRSGADLVAVMAGDGQMDPADLSILLDTWRETGADYVKGDRFRHPDIFRTMPLSRLLGSVALSLATRAVSGYWSLFDSQCGYTLATRAGLESLNIDTLWTGYGYPNDILTRAHIRGLRLAQAPVRPVYHPGHTRMRMGRILKIFPPLLVRLALARAAAEGPRVLRFRGGDRA